LALPAKEVILLSKIFGTDGIRGIANLDLTCELAMKVGRATALVLSKFGGKVMIARDTRISSSFLENAIASGVCSAGADSIMLGVVPTATVAFLVKYAKADAGIMISASHNSFEFNGIKIFDSNGFKLSNEIEEKIENLLMNNFENHNLSICEYLGRVYNENNLIEKYVKNINSKILENKNLSVVFDCANGASCSHADKIFENKINSEFIFNSPDGININDKCGSTNLDSLSNFVVRNKFDLGIAFDGDADRCLAVDETGKIIDGDEIMAVCALDMSKKGKLIKNSVVGTLISNMGLEEFLRSKNIKFLRSGIGDRCVFEEMIKNNFVLGGEQSGHLIFLEHSTTGDGMLTAAMLINVITERKIKASEIKKLFEKTPQISRNIKINPDEDILENPDFKIILEKAKEMLKNNGRIFVRKSGTEPLLRIMYESKDLNKLKEAEKIIDCIFNLSKNVNKNV
jgi:phosphoglucosamine mutase